MENSFADFLLYWINFRRSNFHDPGQIPESGKTIDDLGKIRCPKCAWQPLSTSCWYCSSAGAPEYYFEGCGAVWNTFETGGKCPGCAHQWRWTTCLRCGVDSLHVDWYPKD